MSRIKKIFVAIASFCFVFMVMVFVDHPVWSPVAFVCLISLIVIVQLIDETLKLLNYEYFVVFYRVFLNNISDKLPNEILCNMLAYLAEETNAYCSIECFIRRIYVFLEGLEDEQRCIINDSLTFARQFMESEADVYKAATAEKPMYVQNVLKKSFGTIYRRKIGLLVMNPSKTVLDVLTPSVASLLYSPAVIFYMLVATSLANEGLQGIANYFYLLLVLLYIYCIDYLLCKRGEFNLFSLLMWIAHWSCTMSFPYFTSTQNILGINLVWFHLNYILLSIMGISVINRLWTQTVVEDNASGLMDENKWLSVLKTKTIRFIRRPFLWISFFLAITGTIYMFALIYHFRLQLGGPLQCLLFSISTYFSGPEVISESNESIFYISETVLAFFQNTLCLANIVQLILEPKLRNRK